VRGASIRSLRELRPQWQVVVILGALVVVLAATVLWEILRTVNANAATAAGQDAQNAARTSAQSILSYDYRTLEANMAKAEALTTGQFRQQYEADAPKLLALAKQAQGVVQANVWQAGIVSESPGQVTVLLFVDQSTTQASNQTPQLSQNRVKLVMQKVGGNWLVAQLQAL
jgi:Mce-associated membrane protein